MHCRIGGGDVPAQSSPPSDTPDRKAERYTFLNAKEVSNVERHEDEIFLGMPHDKHVKAFPIVLIDEPSDAEALDPATVAMVKAHQMPTCIAGRQSMHRKFRHESPAESPFLLSRIEYQST